MLTSKLGLTFRQIFSVAAPICWNQLLVILPRSSWCYFSSDEKHFDLDVFKLNFFVRFYWVCCEKVSLTPS